MDTGVDFCQDSPPVRVYSNKNHYDLEYGIDELIKTINIIQLRENKVRRT